MNEFNLSIRKIGAIKSKEEFDKLSLSDKEYVCFITGYQKCLTFGTIELDMIKKWNEIHLHNEWALIKSISKK